MKTSGDIGVAPKLTIRRVLRGETCGVRRGVSVSADAAVQQQSPMALTPKKTSPTAMDSHEVESLMKIVPRKPICIVVGWNFSK